VLTEAIEQPTKHGRQLLREVLTGPPVFTSDGPAYRFRDLTAGAVADADRVQSVKTGRDLGRADLVTSPTGTDQSGCLRIGGLCGLAA
jgi:hypothetical protein